MQSFVKDNKQALADDLPGYDDVDPIPEVPTIDMEEEDLEEIQFVYPTHAGETICISGPLLHGVALSEADEKRRMTRAQARSWVYKKYGRENVVEMVPHPHRWVARVKKGALGGGK